MRGTVIKAHSAPHWFLFVYAGSLVRECFKPAVHVVQGETSAMNKISRNNAYNKIFACTKKSFSSSH
jgi:hypothetical protein